MGSVVILSGPVGAGKSTVAKELVALTPAPVALIEGDVFWQFFQKSTPSQDMRKNFRINMGSMLAASLPFARGGYQVVIDFSIPPWYLDTATKIICGKDHSLDYVFLFPSVEVCADRAANRAEGAFKDYSEVRHLYEAFAVGEEKYRVSDDTSDAKTLAEQIRARLDAGDFRVVSAAI